jgi:PAS domain S-box-containing protein
MKKRNKTTNPPGKFQAWAYSKNHEPKIFKHLAEMLDDFVIVLDRKCNLVSAHGRWLKRYGSSLAQYYGQPIMDSVDRSSKAVAASALRKALSGRTTRCVIFHEKELRWLAVNLSPLKDTRGKINRILGLGYDITELKEKEDRFKVATNRESEFTCAFRCGKDGAIRRIWHVGNFFRLTGTHLSKIRNISILPELIHQASSAEWERFIAELKAGHIAKTEICVLHSRRDVVWIEVTMRPLFLGSCLTGGIFTLRDMTERRMAQQVVLDRQMQYRFLVENASDMIFTLNIDGRNLFVSPSVEHRLGYKPSEMVDRLCFDFIHPEDAAKSRDAMRRAVERPQDRHSILIRMKDKLGVWRVLEIVGKFLPQQDGSAVFIISGRDLTERLISDRRRHLLEEAVQSVEEGILILEKSESLKPVFANKGFQNTLGLGVTVLVEKGLETLRGRGNEPGRWEEMMDHLESGDTWVGELIFRDDAGHNLDGLVEVRAIRGVDGLASGRVVTIRDITETKRAQELLLKYERLATVGPSSD